MKRVAVFGNAGGGKSALARRLSELTGLPLHVIDKIQFRPDADKVPQKIPHQEYRQIHAGLLRRDEWIIDGFDDVASAWERFTAADTLIYVDLPVATHYWWVTKRFIGGLVADPKGWPDNSPLWESTLSSYRVIPLCHRHLTPQYRQLVADAATSKRVHHLRSAAQIRSFLAAVENESANVPAPRNKPSPSP